MNCENCKKLENEISCTLKMQREWDKSHNDCMKLYQKYKKCVDFIQYVKEVTTTRMTFNNPNEDTKSCLNFIDTTLDDLSLRIEDLKTLGILEFEFNI